MDTESYINRIVDLKKISKKITSEKIDNPYYKNNFYKLDLEDNVNFK